jgi:hypothetical protein
MPGIQRPTPPASVLNAVKVMYACTIACVIHVVLYFVTLRATKAVIEKKDPTFSASQVSGLLRVVLIVGVVVALAGAALFFWIARLCESGKSGARVTATVLLVIDLLLAIYNLGTPEVTAARVFPLVVVLIGLAAVVLLWRRSSNAYFSFFQRPQF